MFVNLLLIEYRSSKVVQMKLYKKINWVSFEYYVCTSIFMEYQLNREVVANGLAILQMVELMVKFVLLEVLRIMTFVVVVVDMMNSTDNFEMLVLVAVLCL